MSTASIGSKTPVKADVVDGKSIEIHADRFSTHKYWVLVDGNGLFQRGRMRVRTFTTVEAAWKAAVKEIRTVRQTPKEPSP